MKPPRLHRSISVTASLLLAVVQGNAQPGLVTDDTVAPGVVHRQFFLAGPRIVNVLEVDLTDPSVLLETTRPKGLVKTTIQASTIDRKGYHVVGSVNADFFSYDTGWPLGNQVVNGMVVRGQIVNSPSDATGERSVANALHVISIAPTNTLHFLPAAPSHREPFR